MPQRDRRPKTDKRFNEQLGLQQPKALAGLLADDGRHNLPLFSFVLMDRAYSGNWGWHLLTQADALRLLNLMCEMARLTWREIRDQVAGGHRRHHHQSVQTICREAQYRLTELHLDDLGDQMFRFRLDGTGRLWGFELGDGIFHALWWDPDHEVYPTEPG